jgi:uncharacterized protein (TIGR03083 family)
MESSRYLDSLAADYHLLRRAAVSARPDAPVPSCPDWTSADLVRHVAEVYLHKTTIMRTGKWPDPWAPDLSGDPVGLLDQTYAGLTAEFAARSPSAPTLTWYEPEQNVAFWIRRMAQETVIHRIDAELAVGAPVTQVPDDIALDGIDELLHRFLGYGPTVWPEEFAADFEGEHLARPGGDDSINVRADGVAWTVCPGQEHILIKDGPAGQAHAAIEAAPDPMLRWLWGRAPGGVAVSGDPAWADYLRRLLVATTQ